MPRQIAKGVGAALIVALLTAGLHAASGQPLIFRDVINDEFTTGFCGYPIQVVTTGTGIFHVFFDESGQFERALITAADIKIQFTNLLTGETIWTPSVNMVQESINDDGTGTKTLRGLLWHLIVPGEGLITADVGRLDILVTFDDQGNVIDEEVVFVAGQQDNAFIPALCQTLAEP